MATVTIYGTYDSPSTQDAREYFRDGDGSVRYVDLTYKAIDAVDMQRFLAGYSLTELVDTEGAEYGRLLGARASVPNGELLSKIGQTPGLLRLPLVRGGGRLAVGDDETQWRRIAAGISSKG